MARFKLDVGDVDSTVRRAWDTTTGRAVVVECGLRSERTRKIQSIPTNHAIAPYERVRIRNRVHVVHPAPLVFEQPIHEFDVAQAIGSMLDGLAWLHDHGVTHGAVDANALTAGPTGGRLSFAGALSRQAHASTEDDVYAASALAFSLLVGESPGPDAREDLRLAESASRPVIEAILAGLDPDASRRPTAAALATMVRGEYLPAVRESPLLTTRLVRLREVLAAALVPVVHLVTSIAHAAQPHTKRLPARVAAAFAMVLLVAGLAVVDQRGTDAFADANSEVESSVADVLAARVETTSPPPSIVALAMIAIEDVIAASDAAAQQPAVSVTVTSTTMAPPEPAPTTAAAPPPPAPRPIVIVAAPTTTAPPPPPTTAAPQPVVTTAPTTTRAVTTTRAATTTRVTTTRAATTTRVTTTRATTTTRVTTTRATTTTRRGNRDDD